MKLDEEERLLNRLLQGKSVKSFFRHRPSEVVIVFTDGARLFVHSRDDGSLELSVTGCDEE